MEAVDGLRRDRARRDRRSRRRRRFGSTGIDPNRIGLQRRAGVDLDLGVDLDAGADRPDVSCRSCYDAIHARAVHHTRRAVHTLEPPTTVATPTDPVPVEPGQLPAIDVLATIPIEREQGAGYNRELFGYGSPIDGFGCRTRALVLIRDSLTPPQIDRMGCAVVAGDWFSTYDGLTWSDPGEIEIDHVVALKEAWDSGANAWSAERLEAFSNDLVDARTLRAVTGAVNQAKSDNDPTNWLPPAPDAVCGYLADWVSIKARWGLSMDESEHGRIRNLLTDRCPGQTIAPWVDVPPAAPTDPVGALPAIPPGAPTAPSADGNCDPSYPGVCIPASPPDLDCADITFRRFEVLPPDPHRFDGDDNGVGCES